MTGVKAAQKMKPFYTDQSTTLYHGDALTVLKSLEGESVHCVVTSPPYFGLRSYGTNPQVWGGLRDCIHAWGDEGTRHKGGPQGKTGQRANRDVSAQNVAQHTSTGAFCEVCCAWRGELGAEPTPALYVAHLVEIFREVRRVMRTDATLWLNIDDSYCSDNKWGGLSGSKNAHSLAGGYDRSRRRTGIKPKNLFLIPERLIVALQDDGWIVRSDIVWNKNNCIPEPVKDRPTRSHEYLYLLAKSPRYHYESDAVKEPNVSAKQLEHNQKYAKPYAAYDERATSTGQPGNVNNVGIHSRPGKEGRNKRSVWTINTTPLNDWIETSRRVRVDAGAATGGSERITSPDCLVHGDSRLAVSNVLDGGREAGLSNHNGDNGSRRAGERPGAHAPTDPLRASDSLRQSSDSPGQEYCHSATGRNKQSRRRGRAPLTTQPCTASAQSPSYTERSEESRATSDSRVNTDESKTSAGCAPDVSDSYLLARTVDRKLSMCTCEYYNTITEKISHFAAYPEELIEPCIKAGCPQGGVVLDCFNGAGTTAVVAKRFLCKYVGIELNPDYCAMSVRRIEAERRGLFELMEAAS